MTLFFMLVAASLWIKYLLEGGASYFIPVFSAALSTLLLRTPLPGAFWQGAAMVCGSAILCWLATRKA